MRISDMIFAHVKIASLHIFWCSGTFPLRNFKKRSGNMLFKTFLIILALYELVSTR